VPQARHHVGAVRGHAGASLTAMRGQSTHGEWRADGARHHAGVDIRARGRTYRDRRAGSGTRDERLVNTAWKTPPVVTSGPSPGPWTSAAGTGASPRQRRPVHEASASTPCPATWDLAEARRRAIGIENVRFVPCDCRGCHPGSARVFDLVFCESGPLVDRPAAVEAALQVLRRDGGLRHGDSPGRRARVEGSGRTGPAGCSSGRRRGVSVEQRTGGVPCSGRRGGVRLKAPAHSQRVYCRRVAGCLHGSRAGPPDAGDDRLLPCARLRGRQRAADGSIEVGEPGGGALVVGA